METNIIHEHLFTFDKIPKEYAPYVEKFTNSSEFSERADFFRREKVYTKYTKGTYQYQEFWREERRRCWEGFSNSKGIRITGQHYFYLNYVQIQSEIEDKKGVSRKVSDFPTFLDLDYYYFHIVEYCRKKGISLCAVKGRRQGWSYKAAAIASHEFNFERDSSTLIGAYLSDYSYLTMNMVLNNCNFLNTYTEFGRIRNPDTKDLIRARRQIEVENKKIWKGLNSSVECITFKDRPSAGVGRSASYLIIDEAALMPNIIESYGLNEPLIKNGSNYTGICIMFGSSDNMETGSIHFKKIFTEPKNFHMLEFSDPKNSDRKICFFSPAYYARFGNCKNPKSEYYGKPMLDENGNSNIFAAIDDLLWERAEAKKSPDTTNYRSKITQYPIYWEEAFLVSTKSPFPTYLAEERLADLETKKYLNSGRAVKMKINSQTGKVEAELSFDDEPISDFPLSKGVDKKGCIEIFEEPYIENPSLGVYISACLPPGEKVLTYNSGIKNIEDVNFEDFLINKDGLPVKINELKSLYLENCNIHTVKIHNSYRTTRFTEEHPIYFSKPTLGYVGKSRCQKDTSLTQRYHKFDFSFKPVKFLEKGDWIKVPNQYKNIDISTLDVKWPLVGRIDFQIENPIKNCDFWWFIGLWLGDGWVDNDSRVCISFNSLEKEYIEKTINIVENLFKRKCFLKNGNGSTTLMINSKQLSKFLNDNFKRCAANKEIPEWVKYLSDNFKLNLIGGFLASDGCITKYGTAEFVSISLKLLEDIQDILFSLNYISNLKKLRPAKESNIFNRISKQQETYSLNLAYWETKKLTVDLKNIDLLKINRFKETLKRKQPKTSCYFSEDYKYIYFKVNEVTVEKYTGYVYNFDCETHTFMCKNITTHNCDPVDDDKAENSDSLLSAFVMNALTGRIVAEYTGRPDTVKEFYENYRRLLIYYNAICLYENNKKGLYAYFENKNSLYLLADTPRILKDMQIIRTTYSTGNQSKGVSSTKETNKYGDELLNSYMREQAQGREEGVTNTHTIPSKALLKEIIYYHPNLNVDRISAMRMLLILKEDRFKLTQSIQQADSYQDLSKDDFFMSHFNKGQKVNNSYVRLDNLFNEFNK